MKKAGIRICRDELLLPLVVMELSYLLVHTS